MQGETKVRKGKMRWPESNRIAKSVRWDLRVFREGVKERDGYWELWGQLGWFGKVLSVPQGSSIVNCSSISLLTFYSPTFNPKQHNNYYN